MLIDITRNSCHFNVCTLQLGSSVTDKGVVLSLTNSAKKSYYYLNTQIIYLGSI